MKYAKMYVALAGSIATALLGVYTADSTLGQVLTVVSVVATAFGTWAVQNAPADGSLKEGSIRGSAEVVNFAPSASYEPPTMSLDPAPPASTDERGEIHAGVSGLIALLFAVWLLLGILWFIGVHIRVG